MTIVKHINTNEIVCCEILEAAATIGPTAGVPFWLMEVVTTYTGSLSENNQGK